MSKLEGKVAIVTGASKGIGAAIARHLAKAGAAVVVNYSSSKEGADRVVAEIKKRGGKAIAVGANMAKKAEIDHLFAEAKKAFGRLDILVNNAGIYEFAPLEDDHRGALPQAVQPQRPGPDPGHPEGGRGVRPRGGQRDQHQLGRRRQPDRRSLGLQRHQGGRRRRHQGATPRSWARRRSGSTRSTPGWSRPKASTPPASSARTSRSRPSPRPRSAGSASPTTSPPSPSSSPPKIPDGSPA